MPCAPSASRKARRCKALRSWPRHPWPKAPSARKNKELIALAIGVTQRCSGCIGFHTKALQKLGATRQELEEMLGIAVYMGGGPALMYAAETLDAWRN